MRLLITRGALALSLIGAVSLTLTQALAASPTMSPGYTLGTFAVGTGISSATTAPDPILVNGADTYVAYQNNSSKTGANQDPSTIVRYRISDAAVLGSWSIAGHCDGLRFDPTSGLLWASVNEDAGSVLYTINVSTNAITKYNFSGAPHGGGYDDIWFIGSVAYIADSAPTANPPVPSISKVTLSGTTATVTAVLMSSANAIDVATGTSAPLNITDADSFSQDPQGNLVLIDQGDKQVIIIRGVGPNQQVFVVNTNTELDDTVWASGVGRLFMTDGTNNTTYTIHTDAGAGTVFTQTPNDSSVNPGDVGKLSINYSDPTVPGSAAGTLGTFTPVGTGFGKPTGLVWVPDAATVRPAATASPTSIGLPRAGAQVPPAKQPLIPAVIITGMVIAGAAAIARARRLLALAA
jgi:hypothetical protein